MSDLRIDPSAAIAELALRDDQKFEHYFPNRRPVSSSTPRPSATT
jgi:hypothetical protein